MHCDLPLFDLDDLVVFQLLQEPRELLNGVQGVFKVVLVTKQGNDELRLLIDSFEGDALFEAELLAEGRERASDKSFRHESVGKSIAVVRKHENLLELVASTDCQFEDVLFGLGSDSAQIADAVADCDCGRVLVDSSDFIALFEDVFDEFIDEFDEGVLADTFPVHQKHRGDDGSAHDDDAVGEPQHDFPAELAHEFVAQLLPCELRVALLHGGDEGADGHRLADFDVDAAVVEAHDEGGLDDAHQRLGDLLLAEQLAGEGVALEHLLVVDGQRDQVHVGDLAEEQRVEHHVEHLRLRREDLPRARA